MTAQILPFDFEEQAVRVIMRDDDPWFVAADICRVLEITNTTQAVQRLDDDEVTLCQTEGSHRQTNLISESGLYALVVRSDKPAAKKFRKWITSDVLPAIRRTGRYEHNIPAPEADPVFQDNTTRDAELWLSMIREARLLGGTRAGRSMWARSPLPQLVITNQVLPVDPAMARDCLAHILTQVAGAIAAARDGFSSEGQDSLVAVGLRALAGGLFVGNNAAVFAHSPWAGGNHRSALRGLAGVNPHPVPLKFRNVSTRGLLIPWDVIDGGQDNE